MWEAIPKIIAAAATSHRGIWALIITIIGVVALIFFRHEPLLFKAGAFILMFIGLGFFGFLASRISVRQPDPKPIVSDDSAQRVLQRAKRHDFSDHNDEARTAYTEARTLYKQEQNRLGEANVVLGLGDLERKLGRNDQAKENLYQAAYLYEVLDMEAPKKLALKSAQDLGGQND